jgi:5'-phosphate synthase pdxT subunit
MAIGVLALQGAVSEHVTLLQTLGATVRELREPQELAGLDGLVLPGGESTTMRKLLDRVGMLTPLRELVASGLPVFGTCAGMVLLAQPESLNALPATIQRNGFGRQRESFEAELAVTGFETLYHGVFIRAPYYSAVDPSVTVLATVNDDRIVAARYQHLLVTAFHPELTEDTRFHQLFLEMVTGK